VFVDVVDVFFDQNEPFMRHIRADWKSKQIRKHHPVWNLVRVIEEVDAKKTPPMQMADFICWGHQRVSTYEHERPWEIDWQGWVTAVGAKNAVRGSVTPLGEFQLSRGHFKEEGQALVELWNRRGQILVTNPSEEYKRFDKMMKQLMYVSHDELKAKLDSEKRERRKAKKKPSAEDRASGDKG
jgi:hypothetical protein